MDVFHQWSRQIHGKITDTIITLAAAFIKFVATTWPKKGAHLDYNTPHVDLEPADSSKTILTVDFKNLLIEYSRD